MITVRACLFLCVAAVLLTGCQTPTAPPPEVDFATRITTRNNSYSLLYGLLKDEKNVGMVLLIKRERSDVKDLITKIAKASGAGAKLLEQFARDDSSIHLKDTMLPSGETATRDAIASTKQKELLGQSGEEFELALLLTQLEALNYAAHLAKVTAQNEPNPDRARALTALSKELAQFREDAFALLLLRQKGP